MVLEEWTVVRDKHCRVYTEYLNEVAGLSSNQALRFRKWAREFVAVRYEMNWGRERGLEQFLADLSVRVSPKEKKQASEAVRHFFYWKDGCSSRLESNETDTRSARSANDSLSAEAWNALNEAQRVLRLQHKSYRTEKSYLGWIRRFLFDNSETQPDQLESQHLRRHLTKMAVESRVAASTQQQAFNALLFFYRNALRQTVDGLSETIRARTPRKLPVVLSRIEVQSIITALENPYSLMVRLMYASGLRLDRPGVPLPDALARKTPRAALDWHWFWLFPSKRLSVGPRSGRPARYHI